jgi:small redox-active disulfide protein 2
MLEIKILGSGCANCQRLEQETKKAVKSMSIPAKFEKVTDYGEIMEYDINSTPGLVINGKVVSSGKIPAQSEIITFLANALEES